VPVAAKLIFSQAPGGTRPAGYDVADGAVGNLVTVTNANNADVKEWTLTMVDVPSGPDTDSQSALVTGAFASGSSPVVTGTFSPDKFGAFLVRLDLVGNDGSKASDSGVFGCPNELGFFSPGFSQSVETSRFNNQGRGWAYNEERIAAAARAARNKTAHLKQDHVFVGSIVETDQVGFVIVGGRRVNPANYATGVGSVVRTMTFRCEMYATPGMTAQVRLFNFTDGVAVASSVLSTSSNTPAALSAVLATPADLPNALKMYEAQLRISAGTPGPTDRAFLLNAYLDITLD
jgi:hypothetical protein